MVVTAIGTRKVRIEMVGIQKSKGGYRLAWSVGDVVKTFNLNKEHNAYIEEHWEKLQEFIKTIYNCHVKGDVVPETVGRVIDKLPVWLLGGIEKMVDTISEFQRTGTVPKRQKQLEIKENPKNNSPKEQMATDAYSPAKAAVIEYLEYKIKETQDRLYFLQELYKAETQ